MFAEVAVGSGQIALPFVVVPWATKHATFLTGPIMYGRKFIQTRRGGGFTVIHVRTGQSLHGLLSYFLNLFWAQRDQ